MPPDPQAQDPREETSKPAPQKPATPPGQIDPSRKGAAEVDIDKILLPQKEVRKTESNQRVSAGILLDQELKAGKEGIQNPTEPPRASTLPAPKPPAEESEVKPLETYQADIERVMKGSNTSIVSIAAAEAQRRAQKGSAVQAQQNAEPEGDIKSFVKKFSMIGAGVLLLAVAAAALAYLLLRPTTVPVAQAPTAPFISVDDTQTVVFSPTGSARDLMNKLTDAKSKVALSLGLVARLVPAVSSTTDSGQTLTAMDAQTFLATIAPNIPPALLRTIQPTYLLGVHVYDANQPFLILKVDSYQEAFSGMLAWEFYIKNDLAPLFTYVPSPHINAAPAGPTAGTSTSTTTSSTSLAGHASSTPASEPAYVPPPTFVDKIVENHDARVLQNNAGDIYLLWTFIDRNTLVITTNAATLREIITRLEEAPVTAVPTQ